MKANECLNSAKIFWYLGIVGSGFLIYSGCQYGSLEQLFIILRPVVFMTEKALGISFYYEPGIGFINSELYTVINRTCSGVGFWVTSLCMLGFSFVPQTKNIFKGIYFLFSFLVRTYFMTIVANTSRVIMAIRFLQLAFKSQGSLERLIHQAIGILVYGVYLCITYFIVLKLFRKEDNYEKTI